jgi:hypothetical protein
LLKESVVAGFKIILVSLTLFILVRHIN